jgi:hypothetical protein
MGCYSCAAGWVPSRAGRIAFLRQGQMVLCAHGKKVAQAIRGWTCKRPCLGTGLLSRTSFGVFLEESKAIGTPFHVLCAFSR